MDTSSRKETGENNLPAFRAEEKPLSKQNSCLFAAPIISSSLKCPLFPSNEPQKWALFFTWQKEKCISKFLWLWWASCLLSAWPCWAHSEGGGQRKPKLSAKQKFELAPKSCLPMLLPVHIATHTALVMGFGQVPVLSRGRRFGYSGYIDTAMLAFLWSGQLGCNWGWAWLELKPPVNTQRVVWGLKWQHMSAKAAAGYTRSQRFPLAMATQPVF